MDAFHNIFLKYWFFLCIFRSEAPLQLTLSVCSSVYTPLAVLYMVIVYIVYNDSLLFLGNEPPSPPLASLRLLIQIIIRDYMRLVFDNGQILFHSLNSLVNCLSTKDKIFAPMDDGRPFSFRTKVFFFQKHPFQDFLASKHICV